MANGDAKLMEQTKIAELIVSAMLTALSFCVVRSAGEFYRGFARKASAFMPGMDSAEAAGFHCSGYYANYCIK